MYIFKDFTDSLLENLNNFTGDYPEFINWGYDLFKLLCGILDKKNVDYKMRLEISAAIAYYVAPNDIIPEEIYGPYGYVDDIFISVYVLRDVADKMGYDFLQEIWNQDQDIKKVMDECYNNSLQLLDDKIYEILKYVGLVE